MFEIGNSLREARVRQGLDYPQVELATKIRAKYIRALEEEEFAVLPSAHVHQGLHAVVRGVPRASTGSSTSTSTTRAMSSRASTTCRQRRPRVHQDRGVERKVVLLALAGIAAVTALVIVAWKFGGGDSTATSRRHVVVAPKRLPTGLRFVGRGNGTYLEIRRGSATGAVVYQARCAPATRSS